MYSRRHVLAWLTSSAVLPGQAIAQGSWGGNWGQPLSSPAPGSGSSVPGGLFVPGAPRHAVNRLHHIEVNFVSKELAYFRAGQPVRGYKVVTPSGTPLRRGRLTEIIARPIWTPGPAGMRVFRANGGDASMLVGGSVPYGHPLNPMGNYKFSISGFGAVRIHGTQSYDYSYEAVETLGCVRLMNGSPGIDELVSLLGPRGIAEGTDVVFF